MINQSVKITGGKYAGLAGVVERTGKNGICLVKISGVANGKPVNAVPWIKIEFLEVM